MVEEDSKVAALVEEEDSKVAAFVGKRCSLED